MGTKNNPSKYDCYAKADPDEPMFILLARDKHAHILTSLWAALREVDGENPIVVGEARACAIAMREWRRKHRKATPTAISEIKETLLFVLRSGIQELLDDPAGAITSDIGLTEWVKRLKRTAEWLGRDWEALLTQEGSPFEIQRLKDALLEAQP
jgi:hypothetical protein